MTLFLGYIQNVQFTPIYVAMERGYFKDAGIDLTLEYSFNETDGITRVGTNNLQFALVSGEQTLIARSQQAPLVYVFRWYQKFPIGVVVPADSEIETPDQLKGKIVGVPGKFGASYTGLQALLHAADLTEADLKEVKAIGFDTAPIVCAGQVEASVVYIANEPESIRAACFDVRVIAISDYANLISNGLVTNEQTIKDQPELVRGMTKALAQGLADTIDDAEAAMAISANGKYVEGLKSDDEVQFKVLTNSIELWKADTLGASDEESWQLTADTLHSMQLLPDNFAITGVWTNEFLE
ncbi:MAG: ABC transporter substrate-binding protein [Anaerolineae bacterium]